MGLGQMGQALLGLPSVTRLRTGHLPATCLSSPLGQTGKAPAPMPTAASPWHPGRKNMALAQYPLSLSTLPL